MKFYILFFSIFLMGTTSSYAGNLDSNDRNSSDAYLAAKKDLQEVQDQIQKFKFGDKQQVIRQTDYYQEQYDKIDAAYKSKQITLKQYIDLTNKVRNQQIEEQAQKRQSEQEAQKEEEQQQQAQQVLQQQEQMNQYLQQQTRWNQVATIANSFQQQQQQQAQNQYQQMLTQQRLLNNAQNVHIGSATTNCYNDYPGHVTCHSNSY